MASQSAPYLLDPDKIVLTVSRLRDRISERFPGSGLAGVAVELTATAAATAARVSALARPNIPLRLLALCVVLSGLAAQIYVALLFFAVLHTRFVLAGADFFTVTQSIDAIVNLLVLAAGAIWFVLTLERRWKRRDVLRRLFELRSFAHVVDMHQLTKDPTAILSGVGGVTTPSSPARQMSEFELARYLDYCSELLALIAKLAALYSGPLQDEAVIAAVNEVEELTSDLGRKIWQKIMIISRLQEQRAPGA